MGGARCSYRNCTVKSDGKIHMFHFPVFDKVRCHQWLTNAQRLDFLNLKVSQLRNRVVCQHHFKPDSFMNYKMDKLRFDAVPTENGPFCNIKELTNKVEPLPICPEEIDSDQLTVKEKKANFSVKYGDFLINSEMDTDKLALLAQQEANIDKNKTKTMSVPLTMKSSTPKEIEIEVPSITRQGNMSLIMTSHKPKNKVHIISEKKISAPVSVKGKLEPVSTNTVINPRRCKAAPIENAQVVENIENMDITIQNPPSTVDLTNSEITLYPQSFIEPQNLPIIHMDQPVSFPPMHQFYDPDQLNQQTALGQIHIINPETISDSSQTILTTIPQPINNLVDNTPLKNKDNEINKPRSHVSPKTLLKSKMPPERAAAIEEKRKFNKKLRDMIEFCLDDSPEKFIKENSMSNKKINKEQELDTLKIIEELKKPTEVKRMASDIINQRNKKNVSTYLAEEPNLPSISEYNIASLEARLKRMEENLLTKIEENKKKIDEMKHIIQDPPVHKKSVMTMTQTGDEDLSKKQLYNEISQFLSPEANSLIYEELFLNKYSKKPVGHSMKRRKF